MEIRKILNYITSNFNLDRGNALCALISSIALAIFFLYRISRPSVAVIPHYDSYTQKNLEAIKQKWYLTRLLFRGPLDQQKEMARKMAIDLGIPFHDFDGRNLSQQIGNFNELLQRISSSQAPEFIFVSHADDICDKDKPTLNLILNHTGSLSKKLLLCLGVSSTQSLPPALASRYREQLIIGE